MRVAVLEFAIDFAGQVVVAVLGDVYDLSAAEDASNAVDGEIEADPTDPEGDTE